METRTKACFILAALAVVVVATTEQGQRMVRAVSAWLRTVPVSIAIEGAASDTAAATFSGEKPDRLPGPIVGITAKPPKVKITATINCTWGIACPIVAPAQGPETQAGHGK